MNCCYRKHGLSSVPLHRCVSQQPCCELGLRQSSLMLLTGTMLIVHPSVGTQSQRASDVGSHCVICGCAGAECTQWQSASVPVPMAAHSHWSEKGQQACLDSVRIFQTSWYKGRLVSAVHLS